MGAGYLLMLIVVSSFGKGLRWEFLTEPAEAVFLSSRKLLFRVTTHAP
jgi:hypothetical protein